MRIRPTFGGGYLIALWCGVAALPVLASHSAAGGEELTEEEKQAGFVSMFNGKDFAGWRFSSSKDGDPPPENWSVEVGVIKLSGGGRPHLGTVAEYADFEMRFQWRAMRDRYNSGFYIRSPLNLGRNQINLAKGGEGRLLGGKLDGAKQVPELQKPPGEWNEWRVLVVGDRVAFWCNGKPAWEGTGLTPEKGHIGLQAEGAPLEFRNLRIRVIE